MAADPAPRSLRLVADPEVEKLRRMVSAMQTDIDNLEIELRAKCNEVKRMRDERNEKLRVDKWFPTAKKLFDFWVVQCEKDPKRTEFGEARISCVISRLKGRYKLGVDNPAREVAKAILGAKHACTQGNNGKRYNELALICRDEAHLEDFIERYELWLAKQA